MFAVVFGTLSVPAYLVGETPNKQATDENAQGACTGLYQQLSSPIESLVSVVFVSALPTATTNPLPTLVPIGPETNWGSGSNPTLNGAAIAGLTVGSWHLAVGSVLLIESVISSIIAFRQIFANISALF
ncbi:hypothetical protein BOTCAL_0209g00040 [Botryotinia calthae]|uniref:Uncharacterized protein n=1 Tax=Botryotinia calthae TaxID=38488 RepID=A0A4Y8CZ24_9HELO|nr:hypothetical protein BOTCAL_0209g00040 [Botryotinia calthae]